jgi:hypothetical protein
MTHTWFTHLVCKSSPQYTQTSDIRAVCSYKSLPSKQLMLPSRKDLQPRKGHLKFVLKKWTTMIIFFFFFFLLWYTVLGIKYDVVFDNCCPSHALCFDYLGTFGRLIVRWHCVIWSPNVYLRASEMRPCGLYLDFFYVSLKNSFAQNILHDAQLQ